MHVRWPRRIWLARRSVHFVDALDALAMMIKRANVHVGNKVASLICHQNRRVNAIKIASYGGSQSEEIEIRNGCSERCDRAKRVRYSVTSLREDSSLGGHPLSTLDL